MRRNRPLIHRIGLIVALAALLLAVPGCASLTQGPLAEDPEGTVRTLVATLPFEVELPSRVPQQPTIPVVISPLEESMAAYFSNPLDQNPASDAEDSLVRAVREARESVDMAIYNISLDSLADALIDAHRRGVRVRMVMESEAMDRSVPRALRQAGIPMVGDQGEGLMHNKFTVIDGGAVWLGSMNYTNSSFYTDFNNLLVIRDRDMAWNYTVNFEEMFVERRFGPAKRANTPQPRVEVGGSSVEVYFSPDDGAAAQVVDALNGARETIDILAYSFTRDDFAEAIIEQAQAGVWVRAVFDSDQVQSNSGGEFDKLRRAGLDARLDGIDGLMHDKVIIIDRQVVITGSYNFSANAERRNDENLVIIQDADLAQQYLEHFEAVYSSAD